MFKLIKFILFCDNFNLYPILIISAANIRMCTFNNKFKLYFVAKWGNRCLKTFVHANVMYIFFVLYIGNPFPTPALFTKT